MQNNMKNYGENPYGEEEYDNPQTAKGCRIYALAMIVIVILTAVIV